MVQHGVTEHEVEALVLERQLRRVAGRGLDLQPELGRVVLERLQHAGRDVGAGRLADHAGLQQVQAEVARPGADLERARERPGRRAEQLRELAEHLLVADLAERDAPLGVVAAGRHVVVATVDVQDLVLGGRRDHWAPMSVAIGVAEAAIQRRIRARSSGGAPRVTKPSVSLPANGVKTRPAGSVGASGRSTRPASTIPRAVSARPISVPPPTSWKRVACGRSRSTSATSAPAALEPLSAIVSGSGDAVPTRAVADAIRPPLGPRPSARSVRPLKLRRIRVCGVRVPFRTETTLPSRLHAHEAHVGALGDLRADHLPAPLGAEDAHHRLQSRSRSAPRGRRPPSPPGRSRARRRSRACPGWAASPRARAAGRAAPARTASAPPRPSARRRRRRAARPSTCPSGSRSRRRGPSRRRRRRVRRPAR